MNPNRKHQTTRKFRTGRRRKGILWDYNGDGRFFTEKFNAFDKRYWRRWNRRIQKNEVNLKNDFDVI